MHAKMIGVLSEVSKERTGELVIFGFQLGLEVFLRLEHSLARLACSVFESSLSAQSLSVQACAFPPKGFGELTPRRLFNDMQQNIFSSSYLSISESSALY
jgi:hypothetical protein